MWWVPTPTYVGRIRQALDFPNTLELFVVGDNRNDSADSAYHLCHPRAPSRERAL